MKISVRLLFTLCFISSIQLSNAQDFTRGVNFTNWFQASSVKQIQFTKYTKQDFVNVKNLGGDVVRLPINMDYMTGGAPNYTIDPLFYSFLDQVVDWAKELNIHLIIDNHTFDATTNTDASVGPILVKVWKQVANHYKDRSNYIYYEIRNEPHGISASAWNTVQQNVITAIRSVDTKHAIVVGAINFNSYTDLNSVTAFNDNNLIYTFHFYDPFIFTHQGATWPTPSLGPLTGVPFPYNASTMPACPSALIGTWVQSSLQNDYINEGTKTYLQSQIATIATFKSQRNAKVWCGEFGVYMASAANADRVAWYETVRKALEANNIAWTIWDYTNTFGLFKKGSNELFDYDLNIPLVSALGFNIPDQKTFIMRPDSIGFDIYTEYIGKSINEASSISANGILDYYNQNAPAEGKYCINFTNVNQYDQIGLDFIPNKDMATLVGKGYALDFWVKGSTAGTSFDIRFIDSKTSDPNDHPWRMGTTINDSKVQWDGAWHHLHIPLTSLAEEGSWDNAWFNPIGKFDWSAVDMLVIASDQGSLVGKPLWFDNIRVIDTLGVLNTVTGVDTVTGISQPAGIRLIGVYPNPAKSNVNIGYEAEETGNIEVAIYNNVGQKVCTLVDTRQTPGTYSVAWNTENVVSGVYYCRIKGKTKILTTKILIMER